MDCKGFSCETIETTGAGDTFCECVKLSFEHGIKHLTDENLKEMLTFANAAAALITTRKRRNSFYAGERRGKCVDSEGGGENMLERFFPDEYISSTYAIPFDRLYEEGYRGIIFDIDNTLVPHGAPADERAKQLFRDLKELGYSCCLLSNNQEPRVKMFNEEIGTLHF